MNQIDSEMKYWTNYDVQNPDGSWTSIAHLLRARDRALKQSLLKEMPKMIDLPPDLIVGTGHGRGFNQAIDMVRKVIDEL